jgi:hypothetical protein
MQRFARRLASTLFHFVVMGHATYQKVFDDRKRRIRGLWNSSSWFRILASMPNIQCGGGELYDLGADLGETNNLRAVQPKQAGVLADKLLAA